MRRVLKIRTDERGAMLVQGAIIFLGLLALTTFVVDHGVLWVARAQAQNAADAGALAGAVALSFDSMTDFTDTGPAKQSAYHVAHGNAIIGQSPNINIDTDVTILGPNQPKQCPTPWSAFTCVQVAVYRNEQRGNPVPIIFGRIVRLTAQGVRATATAVAATANASNCLKPWVIVDRWQENSKPPNNTFNPGVDVYIPPSQASPGTGYNVTQDVGTFFVIKAGSPGGAITTSWYSPVDLPLPPSGYEAPGGAQYRTNIETCSGWPVKIGDVLPPENGNMVGPTKQGVDALVALDPGASWSTATRKVVNSCAPACGPISPRIVALAVVDPRVLAGGAQHGKGIQLQVTNILGFFINGMQGNNVTGYLTPMPGLTIGTVGPASGFLLDPILIR